MCFLGGGQVYIQWITKGCLWWWLDRQNMLLTAFKTVRDRMIHISHRLTVSCYCFQSTIHLVGILSSWDHACIIFNRPLGLVWTRLNCCPPFIHKYIFLKQMMLMILHIYMWAFKEEILNTSTQHKY